MYTNSVSSTQNLRNIARDAVEETGEMKGYVIALNGNSFPEDIFFAIGKLNDENEGGILAPGTVLTAGNLNVGLNVPSLRYLFQQEMSDSLIGVFQEIG